jgi:hypothetical protein
MLKLIALDEDDLRVISAHLQDAVASEADIAYLPAEKRLVMMLNRFDWEAATASGGKPARYLRRRCVLRFDKVEKLQVQKIAPGKGKRIFEILAVDFETAEAPSGHIDLVFAGDSAMRLWVECIEVELRDTGAVWRTRNLPHHPDEETPDTSTGGPSQA